MSFVCIIYKMNVRVDKNTRRSQICRKIPFVQVSSSSRKKDRTGQYV